MKQPALVGPEARFAPGRLTPRRNVAGADAVLLEIALVVFLGAPKVLRWNNLRDDRTLEDSSFLERFLGLARRGLLLEVVEEDRRAILRAVVGTLAIHLRRIVALKEDGEKLAIGNLLRVEFHFDSFGVASAIRANLFVCWAFRVATGVSDGRVRDAFDLPEGVLDAPETACRKSRFCHGLMLLSPNLPGSMVPQALHPVERGRGSKTAGIGSRADGWAKDWNG